MALNFKIYKSNANNGTKDKFYARASHKDTVSIKELAAVMQNNCTVKHSDIVAVLSELSEVMKQELQRGNRVRIDGLGTFKVNIRSKGAKTAKEFTVSETSSAPASTSTRRPTSIRTVATSSTCFQA